MMGSRRVGIRFIPFIPIPPVEEEELVLIHCEPWEDLCITHDLIHLEGWES